MLQAYSNFGPMVLPNSEVCGSLLPKLYIPCTSQVVESDVFRLLFFGHPGQ